MPRGLTTDQVALLASRIKGAAYFVELSLTAPVRIWTGSGPVTALGNTWAGIGEVGIIQGIESSRSLSARSISVALVGIPAQNVPAGAVAATRGIRYQGKDLTAYIGFTDVDTGALIGDPTPIWVGVADVMTFQLGDTVSCSLTGEHYSTRLRLANGLRMTSESHNTRLGNPAPADLFFEPQDRLMGVARQVLK